MSFADADVLILGGSMLGIELCYQLRRQAKKPVRIAVVDRQPRHPYIPLCHERLSGRVPAASTVVDSAGYVTKDPSDRYFEGEIVELDLDRRVVTLDNGDEVRGRIVVVALGSRLVVPESIPGGEQAFTVKSSAQWERANARLEQVLRGASGPPPRLLVVGGGITGVELAGEFAHLRSERPSGWASPEVTLVHAGDHLLPALTPAAGRRAARLLEQQGVDLRLKTRLDEIHEEGARLTERAAAGDERVELPCQMVFWAGGITPPEILPRLGLPMTQQGWLSVGPTLQCFPTPAPTRPDFFAAGDVARIQGGGGEWPTMKRAIECIWQAKTLARNVLELLAEPAGYPEGVPPLHPHTLREDFPHGVSIGARSLIVYGRAVTDLRGGSVWFRRFLMRQYIARYAG